MKLSYVIKQKCVYFQVDNNRLRSDGAAGDPLPAVLGLHNILQPRTGAVPWTARAGGTVQ